MKEVAIFFVYAGVSTILFLIVLLLNRLKEKVANKILVIILCALFFLFLSFGVQFINKGYINHLFLSLGTITPYLLGPSIYFYVNAIYKNSFNTNSFLKHCIPFIIILLLFSIPSVLFLKHVTEAGINSLLIGSVIIALGMPYLLFYLIQSYKAVKKYKEEIKHNYSSFKNIDLKWLLLWIKGFILFFIIDLLSGIFIYSSHEINYGMFFNIIYLAFLIFYIGYFGLNQPHIFLLATSTPLEQTKVSKHKEIKTNLNSALDCDSSETIKIKTTLNTLFEEEHIFKNQQISLKELAELLNITDKRLSAILNTCLHTNFYEYVNKKRIAHFKKLVEEGNSENLTLLALAFDAGFNSKATFNRVFKLYEGVTPLQYKKSLIKRSQSV